MSWHLLPPQTPEDCRFRSEPDAAGDRATCGLVRTAIPEAEDDRCRVPRATCLACCRCAPATPTSWNPVVGSLVYHAAYALLRQPDARPDAIARAEAVRKRALVCLDAASAVAPSPPTPLPRGERGRGEGENPPPLAEFRHLADLIPPPARRHPARVRKWAVAVTTAPRPRPTLEACLRNLARAGWESPHLFLDSAVRVPSCFGHLPGTLRSPAVGAWPNHYLALLELSLRQPDADAFLVVQDDALLYDGENVRAYLEEALWPAAEQMVLVPFVRAGRLPVVSLYCPEPYTAQHYGWHRYRKQWVWGALALVFPRATAHVYLRDRAVCDHRWQSSGGGLTQIDTLLGWWTRRRRVPLWFPTPSLVQHIGATSTLWSDSQADGPRAARLFAGDRPLASAPLPREERGQGEGAVEPGESP